MFNGIIEYLGKFVSLTRTGNGARLAVEAARLAGRVKKGDSVAVDGICLTVAARSGKQIRFDVSAETWKRTNLSACRSGQFLNLELPLTAAAFVSGHFVQGHVEGIGRVRRWIRDGDNVMLFVDLPSSLAAYCVPKGSIAINGVSLTVASMRPGTIGVALIPYTLSHTNLNQLQTGDPVNIETDILGRYVVSTLKKTYDKRRLQR